MATCRATPRTVNYKPAAVTDTTSMWTPALVDPAVWRRDMLAARALGFTTLRVFLKVLPATADDSAGGFNCPTPTTAQLARLAQFCAAAKQQGVTLQLCLFDWYGSYGHLGDSRAWLSAVASAVDPSVIGSVELQNETQFGSTATYSGGTGSGDPPLAAGTTVGQAATAWARAMLPLVRAAFPGIPVVCSCFDLPSLHLAAGVAGGVRPDRWEWHCYSAPQNILPDLRAAMQTVDPAPLAIGETGRPSSTAGEQASADYLALVRACCQVVGLPDPAPWCLLDMPGLTKPTEASFGLLGADYRIKAAGRLYV